MTMDIIKGLPVNSGLVIGSTFKFSSDPLKEKTLLQKLESEFHGLELSDIDRIKIIRDSFYEKITGSEQTEKEICHFKNIVKKARKDLIGARKKLSGNIDEKFSEILDFQILALKDTNIFKKTIELIKDPGISAYLAVSIIFNERIELLRKNDMDRLRNRAYDLVDLYNRLVFELKPAQQKKEGLKTDNKSEELILLTRKMFPSDLAKIELKKIKGIVIERQNPESHTSILIKSLEIPYMIKTDKPLEDIREGSRAILDCYSGKLIINPDQSSINKYLYYHDYGFKKTEYKKPGNKKFPLLFATVNTLEEVRSAAVMGVEGIGLFRSELSFLNGDIGHSTKEQLKVYKKILQLFPDRPVTLRVIDLSGDKSSFMELIYKKTLNEDEKKHLISRALNMQIEALVRASIYGNLIIAFPMISRPEDMADIREKVLTIAKESGINSKDLKKYIHLSAFIETPASVIALEGILDQCDSINIGTNDLLSLFLGISRQLNTIPRVEDFLQPPTIKILMNAISTAHKKGKKVTACGEIVSSQKLLPILIGLETDAISVEFKKYPSVKSLLYRFEPQKCRELVRRLKKIETEKEIIRELTVFESNKSS